MNRNPKIARYIRTAKLDHRLVDNIANHATQITERRLKTAEALRQIPAHSAYELMRVTAQSVCSNTMYEVTLGYRYLNNLLQHQNEEQEAWLKQAAIQATHYAMWKMRHLYTQRYGFPVITPEAISIIGRSLAGRPALEIGAGNGYLAHRLQQAGIDVLPTDAHLLQTNPYDLGQAEYTTVLQAEATTAILEFPELELLWSWPEAGPASWQALQQFQGETFIYIGEHDPDGCTGGQDFHDLLEQEFKAVEFIRLPNFPQENDQVGIYQRR